MGNDNSIVILTGAGISKESGLSTFRDADGIWAETRLEDVATPEAFAADPARVHGFYNQRRRGLLDSEVTPNAAHQALARLEAEWNGDILLVTQNIDNLHERAGSQKVIHMHGSLLEARCLSCTEISPWLADMDTSSRCLHCDEESSLRVNVVWFGEMPMEMDVIFAALATCNMFISIGTSGTVYPAAGFIAEVRDHGKAKTVELNLEPSEGHSLFAERRYGPASQTVTQFVEELLS